MEVPLRIRKYLYQLQEEFQENWIVWKPLVHDVHDVRRGLKVSGELDSVEVSGVSPSFSSPVQEVSEALDSVEARYSHHTPTYSQLRVSEALDSVEVFSMEIK